MLVCVHQMDTISLHNQRQPCVCYYSTLDSSLMSNIQKLFYERIEVFATVEFHKGSIVTGIVKIFLKACISFITST